KAVTGLAIHCFLVFGDAVRVALLQGLGRGDQFARLLLPASLVASGRFGGGERLVGEDELFEFLGAGFAVGRFFTDRVHALGRLVIGLHHFFDGAVFGVRSLGLPNNGAKGEGSRSYGSYGPSEILFPGMHIAGGDSVRGSTKSSARLPGALTFLSP